LDTIWNFYTQPLEFMHMAIKMAFFRRSMRSNAPLKQAATITLSLFAVILSCVATGLLWIAVDTSDEEAQVRPSTA
jgi:hypothetical protein